MDSFKKRLSQLQEELKAPKNLYNQFGKYSYRNAEGILEAVKPLLVKYNMILTVSDEITQIGERYYIKAIAKVEDNVSEELMLTTAYARESLDKKGMDDSQITGTASSYARKYALNGLFLLDDTKDADTDEYHNQTNKKNKEEQQYNEQTQKELSGKATQAQINAIKAICKKHKIDFELLMTSNSITEQTLTKSQATMLLTQFNSKYGDE